MRTRWCIAQDAITGDKGEAEIGALAAGYSISNANALIAKLVGAGGALSGAIAGLDAGQGADSVLWVLNTGTDSVVLRVTDSDTVVADTLTTGEVQLIGVFAGTGQMAAGDFV